MAAIISRSNVVLCSRRYAPSSRLFSCSSLRRAFNSIFPAHLEDRAWRLSFFGEELEGIEEFDPLTGEKTSQLEQVRVFANSHYVTPKPTLNQAINEIKIELKARLKEMHENSISGIYRSLQQRPA